MAIPPLERMTMNRFTLASLALIAAFTASAVESDPSSLTSGQMRAVATEIDALTRQIDALRASQQAMILPDYAPDLAKLAERLDEQAKSLASINARFAESPPDFTQDIAKLADRLSQMEAELRKALEDRAADKAQFAATVAHMKQATVPPAQDPLKAELKALESRIVEAQAQDQRIRDYQASLDQRIAAMESNLRLVAEASSSRPSTADVERIAAAQVAANNAKNSRIQLSVLPEPHEALPSFRLVTSYRTEADRRKAVKKLQSAFTGLKLSESNGSYVVTIAEYTTVNAARAQMEKAESLAKATVIIVDQNGRAI